MTSTPTLLVFLKHPTPGRVKTRLAAAVGPERAAALYRGWVGTVFANLQPARGRVRVVGYFDGGGVDAFADWHAFADDWWPQPAGDLGVRLAAGFDRAHAAGGPALAVGTDCLDVDAGLVDAAVDAVRGHDAAFGPTGDGGYYLVAAARPLPGFFDGVRWSTEHTLADQLARCRAAGWSAALLPPRDDIDTWDDWLTYCDRRGRDAERA